MRGNHIVVAVVLSALALPGVAPAADCGAPGKIKIFDRLATTGKARMTYRSGKVPCVDKGPAGALTNLSGSFDIAYIDSPGSARGAFVMPSPWYLNTDARAKYLNRDAPLGGGVKIAGFKQAQNVRVSARSMGDGQQLDIVSGPPGPSGVLAIATVNNSAGGVSTRVCTRWSIADGSIINWESEGGGTAAKLFLSGGVASACNVAPIPTTTTTSTTVTTSTSTSVTTSTSTSVTTTTSTSITTTTTLILEFITGTPNLGVPSGAAKNGGAGGTVVKVLGVGGLNIGGGCSQGGGSCGVAQGPTPGGASTRFRAACAGTSCTISALNAAGSGSNRNCSATGCNFGTFLPIANGGTSTCVRNVFSAGGTGTLDLTTGAFDGSVPLTSNITLTGNGSDPCPRCLGGTPGVTNSGNCDPSWEDSSMNPSPTDNAPCTPTDAAGSTYDCVPAGLDLGGLSVPLNPISTGTEFFDTTTDQDMVPGGALGAFCPGQDATEPGSVGCFDTGGGATLCDYIEETGVNAAGISIGGGPVAARLASVFCIPPVPGVFGGLINGAADLPGPGATSLPGTLELR